MKYKMTTGQKLLIAILIITLIAATILGLYAWSKYIITIPGETTAKVAKWHFDLKNTKGQSLAETGTIDLAETLNFEHMKTGTIAPGTSGQFEMVVDTTGTEVSLEYNIEIKLTNCPTNLNFYKALDKDSAYTEANKISKEGEAGDKLIFKGYVDKDEASKFTKTITVFWNWPYETKDVNNSTVTGDAADKSFNGQTISMQITATGTEVLEEPKEELKFPVETEGEIDYAILGTKILSTEGNRDWQVFYEDSTAGKTYLMLADYLPYAKVPTELGLEKGSGSYTVKLSSGNGNSREKLIEKLTDKTNWKKILPEELQAEEYKETIEVTGAIDLEIWLDSWNSHDEVHGGDYAHIYKTYQNGEDGKTKGYIISATNSEPAGSDYADLSKDPGRSNKLYFPHSGRFDNCDGYWLASPSAYDTRNVMRVSCASGRVGNGPFSYDYYGVRPVVCLPSELLSKVSN